METRQWMTIPVDEFEALHAQIRQLRAHDKEATDLTIDQQVEIGRLHTALQQFANPDNWEHEHEGEAAWLWLGYQAPFESAAIALGYPPRKS